MTTQIHIHSEPRPSIAQGQLTLADGNASEFNVELTIRQLVAEQPRRARILEQYDLPYCCCGGNPTLSQACAKKGINLQNVLRDLENLDARHQTDRCELYRGQLTGKYLNDLAPHLEGDHRSYLRKELPRLCDLIGKVIKRHGELYPELWELQEMCDAIEATVERYIAAEERLMALATATLPDSSSQVSPISQSETGRLKECLGQQKHYLRYQLTSMHSLMTTCTPPEAACNTYRVLLESASEIDRNIHNYVREVESVLGLMADANENQPFGGCEVEVMPAN